MKTLLLLLCLGVVLAAASDGKEQSLLRAVLRKLAHQEQSKNEDDQLESALDELTQVLLHEQKKEAMGEAEAEEESPAPVDLAGLEFRIMPVGDDSTTKVTVQIVSSQESDVTVRVVSSGKHALYVVPQMGLVQLTVVAQRVPAGENPSPESREFPGIHITATLPVKVTVLMEKGRSAEQFLIPPLPEESEAADTESRDTIVALSDLHDMELADKHGYQVHVNSPTAKREHMLVARGRHFVRAADSSVYEDPYTGRNSI